MTVARCTAPEAPASDADSAAALFKPNPTKYKPVPCIKHVSSAHELARAPQNFRLGALQYSFPVGGAQIAERSTSRIATNVSLQPCAGASIE
jgi:hypothetical protein